VIGIEMKLCSLLAALLLLGTVSAVAGDAGPLSAQNRFPLHLLFLTPRPASAVLPAQGALRGTVAMEYSSVYFDQRSSRWDVLLDMETTVVDLCLTYGLTPRLAVRLDAPLVSMNSGFLDGFLESYHNALGVGNYGREDRPGDTFAYQVDKGGRRWLAGESGGFGLADVTLSAQWAWLPSCSDGQWSSALTASIKAPTGDSRLGYGSGRFDFGLFLPSQWSGRTWTLYVIPGYIWRGHPDSQDAGVAARDGYSLFFGAAYEYSDRWRWLAQVNYFTSPLEKTGISRLDDGALEVSLGFQRSIGPNRHVEFAFSEDLFTLAAPDFNIRLGVVWSWGEQAGE
jgi:hypothetical protein